MTSTNTLSQHAYDLDALIKLLESPHMDKAYILNVARGLHRNAKTRLSIARKAAGVA